MHRWRCQKLCESVRNENKTTPESRIATALSALSTFTWVIPLKYTCDVNTRHETASMLTRADHRLNPTGFGFYFIFVISADDLTIIIIIIINERRVYIWYTLFMIAASFIFRPHFSATIVAQTLCSAEFSPNESQRRHVDPYNNNHRWPRETDRVIMRARTGTDQCTGSRVLLTDVDSSAAIESNWISS